VPNDHENWCPWMTKAEFSEDRVFRYTLERVWWPTPNQHQVAFIGLNPSTADEQQDDPTVRRCIRYAKKWGYSGMVMLNIFAIRGTDPRILRSPRDIKGPLNDHHIARIIQRAETQLVIGCWGNWGELHGRGKDVIGLVKSARRQLYRLGPLTKLGHPRHPLYLKGDLQPELL
jgi:hypothetical protein